VRVVGVLVVAVQRSRIVRCGAMVVPRVRLVVEVGSRSNSVPLPLYRTTAGIDSNLDC
jgi:hypothetical protein